MAKILLVEDDNNLREIYEARLQAEGYDISSAQDGEEALVVAKQVKPDLIISDVMMPKISGFEMLDILRNTPGLEHVRVIMLTALGQAEDQARANDLGADKYLVKSQVTLEDIIKTAQELVGDDGAPAPAAVADSPAAATTPAQPPMESTAPPVQGMSVAAAPEPSVPAPAAAEPPAPTADPAAPTAPTETSNGQATPGLAANDANAAQQVANDAATPGSTEEEAATVQDQIDSFAQQVSAPSVDNTTPATAPATPVIDTAASTTSPAPNQTASPTEPIAAPPTDPTAADDQLMAEAVSQLSGGETVDTAELAAAAPVTPEPASTPAANSAEPVTVTPTEPAPTAESPTAANDDNVRIPGKKVIQPLSGSEKKPDINELLAREESGGNTPPAAAPSAPAEQPDQTSPSAATPTPTSDFDPNNIAL